MEADLSAMDPQARRFLAMVGLAGAHDGDVSPAARRDSFARLMRYSRAPEAAITTENYGVAICGFAIGLRTYAPAEAPCPSPALVYFHGGGLVAGSLDTHDALCRTLAIEARCRIVAVEYPLAPEHPFPAAIFAALAATRWALKKADALEIDGRAIGVGGDSGGATLATIVARLFRRGILKAQLLLCPVMDFADVSASKRAFGTGFLLDTSTMTRDLVHYAPRRPLDDPFVSPLRAKDFARMPPTIVHTAGFDPLRDEGVAYVDRLRDAGVEVRHTDHPALLHHFYGLTGVIPAARPALSRIAADLAQALAS